MLAPLTDQNGTAARRDLLAKILRERTIERQAELVELLRRRGHPATQSSVSRDLRELGVAKLGRRYVLSDEATRSVNDFSALRRFVISRVAAGANLTVIKTKIGTAQSVAVAIDSAAWPEVAGTISGDDTIFIATASARDQRRLGERLLATFGI
ncbi:MAG: arginine repressor [Gammaproteobacteria bacterium]|nr:arginine repressor [Gammaproteobacteria bacterium]